MVQTQQNDPVLQEMIEKMIDDFDKIGEGEMSNTVSLGRARHARVILSYVNAKLLGRDVRLTNSSR